MSWQEEKGTLEVTVELMMKYREALAGFMDERASQKQQHNDWWGLRATASLALHDGDAYFVTGNIVDLIEATAADLPGDASLEPQCLLSPHGFAWFEHPMPSVATHAGPKNRTKGPAPVTGLSWYHLPPPRDGQLCVQVYGDTGEVPCWPIFAGFFNLCQPVAEYEPDAVYRGDPEETHDHNASDEDYAFAMQVHRTVLTFFLFVQQKIVLTELPKITRQQRRLAERKNKPLDVPLIVTLRRAEKSKKKGDKTGMTLQLRVPTRPHWQRYHKGPKSDPTQQRVEWQLKDLYWRGPEDAPVKPLVQRVFNARR